MSVSVLATRKYVIVKDSFSPTSTEHFRYVETSSSGPLILYTSRLAVRIEGFLKFALRQCSTVGQPRPRGLEFMETWKVEKAMKAIRKTLDEKVIPMLEYWIDPVRCKKVDHSNLVHAHLIYLFKNYTYEEFDYRSISVLLTSQVYLSINHRFSNKAYDDLADSSDPSKPPPSIQIAQSEIFDIIQSKRYHMLQYMRENPADANAAMEAVVRIATGTGPRAINDSKTKLMKQRNWKSIGHVRNFCWYALQPIYSFAHLSPAHFYNSTAFMLW